MSGGEHLVKFVNEGLSAVAMDVQAHVSQSYDVTLSRLHRESRVDEEHGVALGHGSIYGSEGGEGALHAASGGNAAQRVDVHADESLDKARCSLLDAWYASVWRIDGGTSRSESFLFCLDSYV